MSLPIEAFLDPAFADLVSSLNEEIPKTLGIKLVETLTEQNFADSNRRIWTEDLERIVSLEGPEGKTLLELVRAQRVNRSLYAAFLYRFIKARPTLNRKLESLVRNETSPQTSPKRDS